MSKREYPAAPRVGVGALVIKDETVLLVKRGTPPGAGLWALPGGMVKLGETLREAVERETLEETGITIEAGEPAYVFDVIEKDADGRILYHYVIVDLWCRYENGEPRGGDDAADARWIGKDELARLRTSRATSKFLELIGFKEVAEGI